jgi:hypothetical protein|tara:strand:- start:285 stop:656 length:372 start_codon:yes stop_codon:yes gene_type:complete
MNITNKSREFYECKIYMGSINEKNNKKIKLSRISDFIKNFQDCYEVMIPVRITKTSYLSGSQYEEKGYELGVINYPRIRNIKNEQAEIKDFMILLAEALIVEFNQRRLSVVDDNYVTMYEAKI